MMVGPGIKTGINIKYDNPSASWVRDRIANAVAAYELYGGPCIFIDFGTATTFGRGVGHKGEFLGGAISPGHQAVRRGPGGERGQAAQGSSLRAPRKRRSAAPPSPICSRASCSAMSGW